MGAWTNCFTILFTNWFSVDTIKKPHVPNQKKIGGSTPCLKKKLGGVKWRVCSYQKEDNTYNVDRRKFRSQTSHNMDTWKAREAIQKRKSEKRREAKRRANQRKLEERRCRRTKLWESRETLCFFRFCGSGLRSLAKAAGAEPVSTLVERWTIARRCGAKHTSKTKCTNHCSCRALLEVEMSKKCTPLRREAPLEVKSAKTEGFEFWEFCD